MPPDVIQRAAAAGASLAAYFQDLIAARRAHLTDDILSGLIRAEEEGDAAMYDELLTFDLERVEPSLSRAIG